MEEKENKILAAMFPYLSKSTNSFCFRFVYGLVAIGILALIGASILTGQVLFFEFAVALAVAGVAGQIFPLFPIGIVNFFVLFCLIVMMLNSHLTTDAKPHPPAPAQVKTLAK